MNALNDLLRAIEARDLPAARTVLEKYPYLFNFDLPLGWPILHQCLREPGYRPLADVPLVKLFVDKGGDVNRRSATGVSLLFLASANAFAGDIAQYLTKCGASMRSY